MPQPRHGTTRHDALSKIGPFSQIGAFQRYNRDKCSVSILPQMCDVTKASSNFDGAPYIVKLQHVFYIFSPVHIFKLVDFTSADQNPRGR